MLQNWSCKAMDNLAREQWRLYAGLGDEMQIDAQERRRVLLLDQREWSDWENFLSNGPLPMEPPLPVMLRRLGRASHHLALLAEHQGASARHGVAQCYGSVLRCPEGVPCELSLS